MSYDIIRSHVEMLQDHLRTEAYLAAIREVVQPGDRVLDFGCGTGVLSIFAERAGAGRVYAVDRSKMISAAEVIFAENACTRIIPLLSEGSTVELPEQVDVIVSEWMGHFLFAEQMLEPLVRLRDKFLRPGGRIVPESCSLHVSMVTGPSLFDELSFLSTRPYGIDFSAVSDLPFNEVRIMRMRPDELLPESACIGEFGLSSVTGMPHELSGTFTSSTDAVTYGICGWFDAQLSPGVKLSTSPFAPRTHWMQFHFPFNRPLEVHAGEPVQIDVQFLPQPEQNGFRWRARAHTSTRIGESLSAET
jgi:SAM-dependent methyltransferase